MTIGNADPAQPEQDQSPAGSPADPRQWCADAPRFQALFERHHTFICRLLRRLGVADSAIEDLVQSAFMVLAGKLDAVPAGSERAFLCATAQHLSADFRRRASARYETSGTLAVDTVDPMPRADELLEQKRARQLLDRILSELNLELRTVFVLFELERLTMAEIAELSGLAPGTVASRLRRARESFFARLEELQGNASSTQPEVDAAS